MVSRTLEIHGLYYSGFYPWDFQAAGRAITSEVGSVVAVPLSPTFHLGKEKIFSLRNSLGLVAESCDLARVSLSSLAT